MNKKIYIGNLSSDYSAESLASVFTVYGSVEKINIVLHQNQRSKRCFAIIEMSSEKEAAESIKKLNGYDLSGRAINVRRIKTSDLNLIKNQ
ncbi:RNA-binding protein [bacterium]|nr:RNA-binding protein [bacterium]